MDVRGTVVEPLVTEALRAWRTGGRPVRFAAVAGAVLVVVGLSHAVAFLVLGGAWQGPVAWRKPFAFGVSFGLASVTAAWVVTRVTVGRRAAWWLLLPFAVACTLEVAWVVVQRARGVPSHFNVETTVDGALFNLGGVSIAVVVVVLVVLLVLSWRRAAAPPALASAIRSGLGILLVSQAVGGQMIARGVASLDQGAEASHAIAPAGDLKVSHALAMHAIQILPALALVVERARPGSALGTVRLMALAYSLVVLASLVQASSGRSVTDPWPPSALLVVLAAGVAAVALRSLSRRSSGSRVAADR